MTSLFLRGSDNSFVEGMNQGSSSDTAETASWEDAGILVGLALACCFSP